MPKKILAVCIDQVLQFDNQAEVEAWKNTLTGTFSIESMIMEPDVCKSRKGVIKCVIL